jgi:hypothetical protein
MRQPPSPLQKDKEVTNEKNPSARTFRQYDHDELVSVSSGGQALFVGRVDDKTEDGTIVWVLPLNGHRRLIHVEDDVELVRLDA